MQAHKSAAPDSEIRPAIQSQERLTPMIDDLDPIETREWMDALDDVVKHEITGL